MISKTSLDSQRQEERSSSAVGSPASKGNEFVLPDEVFVDTTKIEWTASTADGEYMIALALIYYSGG